MPKLPLLLFILSTATGTIYANESQESSCQKVFNYYSKDNQQVYYLGKRIFSADNQSFQVIAESSYGKDKENVYFKEVRIAGADPVTFEVIKNDDFTALAKDKYRVYQNETVIEGANPQYFVHIAGHYYKDDTSVFYQGIKLKDANPKTFIVYNGWYSRDNQYFYYHHAGISLAHTGIPIISAHPFKELKIEQPEQLTFIEKSYFKDQNNFYIFKDGFMPLTMSDPKKFTYIAKGYFHDGKTIYYNQELSQKLTQLDANFESFKSFDINNTLIFEDQNSCFSEGIRTDCDALIEEQNTNMLSPFSMWANQGRNTKSIEANCGKASEQNSADDYRYQISRWSHDYSVSKQHVYYQDEAIKNADPATFEYIGSHNLTPTHYFRDKNHVYLNGKIVKGVDAASFVMLSDLRARDKNKIYTWQELGELQEE